MFRDDTFLARWLSGNLSDSERQEFEGNPEHQAYVSLINTIDTIESPAFDEEKSLQNLRKALAEKTTSSRPVTYLPKLAAAAAAAGLLFLFIWFLLPSKGIDLHTNSTQIKKITLPDGSQATLQPSAEIRYVPKHWPRNRQLILKGEAFFKVNHGSKFTIQSLGGKVEVLGTSFNVITQDSALAVQCFSGKVRVIGDPVKTQAFVLEAGDFVQIHTPKDKPLRSTATTLPILTQGESIFYAATLTEVFTKIESQYKVTIPNKENFRSRRFTGVFRNDDLEMALRMVCIPMELTYEIKDKLVLISDH
jgi:ferric-dicitrate binding protein FerR (iron transport regulator)